MTSGSGLAEIQLALQRFVLGEANAIAPEVRAGYGIGARRRLGIYHGAYRARLAEALRDAHGHTAVYLGEQLFDRLAAEYVEAHRSAHGNLRWYGESFAPWLRIVRPGSPELSELAAIDWALRRAFDGPDCAALALAQLAAIAPEALQSVRLVLQPTAHRLRLERNSIALWHAIDAEHPLPAPEWLPEPVEVLVWRRGLQPHFRSLGAIETAALAMISAGTPFTSTCERLAARFPGLDIAREAGSLLRRWIDDELLAGPGACPYDAASSARKR